MPAVTAKSTTNPVVDGTLLVMGPPGARPTTTVAVKLAVTVAASTGPTALPRFLNVWFIPVWIPSSFGFTESTMMLDIAISTATFPTSAGTVKTISSTIEEWKRVRPSAPRPMTEKPVIITGFGPFAATHRPHSGANASIPSAEGSATSPIWNSVYPKPGENGSSTRIVSATKMRNIPTPTITPFTFEIQMFRSLSDLNETTGAGARGSQYRKNATPTSASEAPAANIPETIPWAWPTRRAGNTSGIIAKASGNMPIPSPWNARTPIRR